MRVPCGKYIGFSLLAAAMSVSAHARKPSEKLAPVTQLATPLMGWNPFNVFGLNYDEKDVMGAAEQLVKLGLSDLGYLFVNIDDGYWLRRQQSTILVRTNLYPSADIGHGRTSLRPFVERLHAMGLKAGIYTDIGPNTCSQRWEKATPNLPVGSLDEREVGSYGHQEQDARLFFVDWGFDFVKVDACGVADYEQSAAEVRNGAYRYFPPLIIRNAWGEGDVNNWAHRYSEMWRTSGDIKANWASILHNFDSAAPRSLFAGPGHWNDPDMLEVGNGEFDGNHIVEARAHMSLWAIIAAPLVLGTDLDAAPPAILDVIGNREVIAVDQDPAGNQGVILSQSENAEVVTKTLAGVGRKAVAMINRGEKPLHLMVDLNELHLLSTATVRDLWRGTSSTLRGSLIEVDLKPHETALLKIKGQPAKPDTTYPDEMPARFTLLEEGYKDPLRTTDRQWVPARIGFLPTGQPVLVNGQHDGNALGVASGSRLAINLNGEFRQVSLLPGPEEQQGRPFFIYADGHLLKKGNGTTSRKPFVLPVENVRRLELVAPPSTGTETTFVWGQVRFKR